MQVMKERDDSKCLSGIIQLDDVYWGGEYRGGKRGRGSPNNPPFVAERSHGGPSVTLALIVMWSQMACFSAVKQAHCQHTRIVTSVWIETAATQSQAIGATLVTNNTRHFQRIDALLLLVNWSDVD